MSWDGLLAAYYAECLSRGVAPENIKNTTPYDEFCRFCARRGVREPNAVTDKHAQAYVDHLVSKQSLHGRPYAARTVHGFVSRLRSFFRWAVAQQHVLFNPFLDLQLPPVPPLNLQPVPSAADVEKLFSLPDLLTPGGLRDRAILELFYGTGLRLRECQRLDVEDVDFDQLALNVRHGKGATARVQPMSERLAVVLRAYITNGRPAMMHESAEKALFLGSQRGRRIHSLTMQTMIRDYSRRLEIEGLHPRAIRRAFATHLLQGGADVRDVRRLMGHASLRTTGIYTPLEAGDLIREHSRTHPRGGRRRG